MKSLARNENMVTIYYTMTSASLLLHAANGEMYCGIIVKFNAQPSVWRDRRASMRKAEVLIA